MRAGSCLVVEGIFWGDHLPYFEAVSSWTPHCIPPYNAMHAPLFFNDQIIVTMLTYFETISGGAWHTIMEKNGEPDPASC